MPKLPQVSGKETIKALQKIGFTVAGQKGSHVKLVRGTRRTKTNRDYPYA